jgi:ABC-type uncharacterized transport system substrate-binding protein
MRRREFITLLGGAATASLAWSRVAFAQQPSTKVFRIGFLGLSTADSLPKRPEAFRVGLRDLGYQEGRDFVIEYRWADGNYDRLPALIADLARLNVDVIVTHGTPGALAAKTATTIPVVLAVVGDPLGSGIVSSLARPGGNVTGLAIFTPELAAKRIELLKEILPDLTDVGILTNSANPLINDRILPQMSSIAQPLKLALHQFDARSPAEFEPALAAMAAQRVGALTVIEDAMLISNAPAVAALALKRRLPSSGWPDYATGGGVIGYGVDFTDMFRNAATFVDKIMKGAKPGDLPIQRATKFEIIVNLKIAKALALTIPYNLLVRANEVIE